MPLGAAVGLLQDQLMVGGVMATERSCGRVVQRVGQPIADEPADDDQTQGQHMPYGAIEAREQDRQLKCLPERLVGPVGLEPTTFGLKVRRTPGPPV